MGENRQQINNYTMWQGLWRSVKESEAGWERWEVRRVSFQMKERLDKGKRSRSPRPWGAEPEYQSKQLEVEVDCPDWHLLWWRVGARGGRGSYWHQDGDCEENTFYACQSCSRQSWLLFQASAGDHSSPWARETAVALFDTLANVLMTF